jgi:hypothetical protein
MFLEDGFLDLLWNGFPPPGNLRVRVFEGGN